MSLISLLRRSLFAAAVFLAAASAAQATTVRLQTVLGAIDLELFDSEAPRTVANFLAYVNSGAYDGSFIHRSVSGFVIQGGGYTWNTAGQGTATIAKGAPVANEFSASRSNLRGTIAMAKVSGNPDSATSEWFINLADNAANLDNQNGGFTVFGRVTGNGMAVVDAIAALPTGNAGGAFTHLPLIGTPANGQVRQENLVMINATLALDPATERVFSYLESAYATFLSPAGASSGKLAGYYVRHYPATGAYVGTAGGRLYYLGPASGNSVLDLGLLSDWISMANSAGY